MVMPNQHFSLARDQLLRSLASYWGITTADGNVGGTTLICASLIGSNDFITNKTIILESGVSVYEDRCATVFAPGTGQITTSPAFSAQVPRGTLFYVLNSASASLISSLLGGIYTIIPSNPIAVAPNTVQDISLSISTLTGIPLAAALTPGTITITRVRAGVETVIVNAAACSAANGRIYYSYTFPSASWQTGDEYKVVFSGQKVLVGTTTYSFSDIRLKGGALLTPSISVVASHAEIVEPDTYAEFNLSVNGVNGVVLNADITAGVITITRIRAGVPTVIVAAGACLKTDGVIYYGYAFPAASWSPGDLYLGVMTGQQVVINGVTYPLALTTLWGRVTREAAIFARLSSNVEQINVAVNVSAISASETDVLNLPVVASTCYTVQNLRLKCADPGANTVTVRLYERVNNILTEVDSFPITGGGAGVGNWETYHSLMDMFGMPHLAGDNLQVTVRASGGAGYAVTGQYSYIKASPW